MHPHSVAGTTNELQLSHNISQSANMMRIRSRRSYQSGHFRPEDLDHGREDLISHLAYECIICSSPFPPRCNGVLRSTHHQSSTEIVDTFSLDLNSTPRCDHGTSTRFSSSTTITGTLEGTSVHVPGGMRWMLLDRQAHTLCERQHTRNIARDPRSR